MGTSAPRRLDYPDGCSEFHDYPDGRLGPHVDDCEHWCDDALNACSQDRFVEQCRGDQKRLQSTSRVKKSSLEEWGQFLSGIVPQVSRKEAEARRPYRDNRYTIIRVLVTPLACNLSCARASMARRGERAIAHDATCACAHSACRRQLLLIWGFGGARMYSIRCFVVLFRISRPICGMRSVRPLERRAQARNITGGQPSKSTGDSSG